MMPFLGEHFGNPHSSDHAFGWEAASAVRDARAKVAEFINADDDEIVFTSGATESCNLAIRGAAKCAGMGKRNRIVTVSTEHPAVFETVMDLSRQGYETVVLPVDSYGIIDPADLDNVVDRKDPNGLGHDREQRNWGASASGRDRLPLPSRRRPFSHGCRSGRRPAFQLTLKPGTWIC